MRNYSYFQGLLAVLFSLAPTAHAEGLTSYREYVSFSGGGALQQNITLRNHLGERAEATFDPGFHLDVTAGLETYKGWAFELETGLIYNAFDEIDGVSLSTSGDNLQMLETPLLFNVLFKPKLSTTLAGYVGVGLGGVATTFYSEQAYFDTYDNDFTFGYQALAGFHFQLSERWELGLAYKFLGTTDHDLGGGITSSGTRTHSLLIGASYKF